MASLSTNSLILARNSPHLSCGSSLKSVDVGFLCPTNVSLTSLRTRKVAQKPLVVQAAYSDGERANNNAGMFVGGFILGGLVVGTLASVYAPQISEALAVAVTGADKRDMLRKLPKFIYDEEKALEKTRKILTDKIEQLNSAIDNVSSQLRSESSPKRAAVRPSDEMEEIEYGV